MFHYNLYKLLKNISKYNNVGRKNQYIPAPQRLNNESVCPNEKNINQHVGLLCVPNNEEKSDDYSKVVIRINDDWRVIECKDNIQWILQSRKGSYKGKPAWRGKSYCRSKEGLIRCVREKVVLLKDDIEDKLYQLPKRK